MKTFTIGFQEPQWDEAPPARGMASTWAPRTPKCSHGADARAVSRNCPQFDEPFAIAEFPPRWSRGWPAAR